jgi:DNA-binding beta-propeller fold protein YncE
MQPARITSLIATLWLGLLATACLMVYGGSQGDGCHAQVVARPSRTHSAAPPAPAPAFQPLPGVSSQDSLEQALPSAPRAIAVDPASGDLYVAGPGEQGRSGWLSVIQKDAIAARMPVGVDPVAIALHPRTGLLYVVNRGSDNISIFHGTEWIATVAVGHQPDDVAVDPVTGYVYVSNTSRGPGILGEPGTVSILSGTQVLTQVVAGFAPRQIEVQPNNQLVYVRNRTGSITVLRGIQLLANVAVEGGGSIAAMAIDPVTGLVYVAVGASVAVLDGTTIVARLEIEGPAIDALAIEPTNGYMYAARQDSIAVLRGTSRVATLPIEQIPTALACLPGTGTCYVAGLLGMGDTGLTIIQGTGILTTTGAGREPHLLVADPPRGRMYLASDGLMAFAGSQLLAAFNAPLNLAAATTMGVSLAKRPAEPAPPASTRPLEAPGDEAPILARQRSLADREIQPETPPMYQLTNGPPGRPAAKQCTGCSLGLDVLMAKENEEGNVPRRSAPGTVSGWQPLVLEDFEGEWPGAGSCWTLYDTSDDGQDRTWGSDGYRAHSGDGAAWPARGGDDGIDPQPPAGYPDHLDSWMICGPFDFSDASSASAAFWLWSEVEEGHDEFFFGVGDGTDDWFYGYAWDVSVPAWAHYTIYFPAYTGSAAYSTVWLAWNFQSNASHPGEFEGPWVDDIEVARSQACPAVDPGNKGLQVHPNELPGQVETIENADTGWVRLEFRMDPDGSLDLARYTGIVDSLCEHGMAVIGLVDYMALPDDLDGDGRKDYDDPEDHIAYQQRFTETVETLAHHFRGTIRHWEIWNEENGLTWHIRPEYYARLLVKVSEVVRPIDADNQILFGGLDHVWATSQYLEPVYDALDLDWAGARPFDILAVHPYFVRVSGEYVLDPNLYLRDSSDPGRTILDPYLDYMASRGDGDNDIWITEIGWNSALDNPAIVNCPGMQAWCVDRATQARYLEDSFDILFSEVQDPQGNCDRVKNIVWYQYHDTTSSAAEMAERMSVAVREIASDPDAVCPADWGLVDGNRQPKPSYGAYQTYARPPTDVTLLSFTATARPGEVLLAWEMASQCGLVSFDLYRSESPEGPHIRINEDPIEARPPGGSGGASYEYEDRTVAAGMTYYYYLEARRADGSTTAYGPAHATTASASVYLPVVLRSTP